MLLFSKVNNNDVQLCNFEKSWCFLKFSFYFEGAADVVENCICFESFFADLHEKVDIAVKFWLFQSSEDDLFLLVCDFEIFFCEDCSYEWKSENGVFIECEAIIIFIAFDDFFY